MSSSAAARLMTARTGVSIVPSTSELVMSAPSQCVKWMISDAAMPGKRYFVPPEKPTTSCGKTGPQMSTWSYSTTSRLSATGTSWFSRPSESSAITAAGIVPSVANVAGSSQRWLKMRRSPARPSTTVRPTRRLSCSSLIGVCVPRATRKSSAATRGAELALEDVEHQRHRHRPRAVGNEDDDALAVERQAAEALPRQVRHLFRREIAFDDAATDDAHGVLTQQFLSFAGHGQFTRLKASKLTKPAKDVHE